MCNFINDRNWELKTGKEEVRSYFIEYFYGLLILEVI